VSPDFPRRLRVALDAIPLLDERTGVGQFTAQLLQGLATRDDVDPIGYAVTYTARRRFAAQLPQGIRPATSWVPARVAHEAWKRVAWPRIEHWTGSVDVVHATNFVAPPTRARVVVTVHDLAFATMPELCRPETKAYGPLLRRALARGATVHAVSDYVSDALREHYAVPSERIVRIYEGAAPMMAAGDPAAGRALAGSPRYVLAIGTIEPRKNLPRLVRAFDAVAAGHPEVILVVAGPDGWGTSAFAAAATASSARDRIRRLGYVTDRQRSDLLAGATALAYPSLDEGFGHPPLEAMAAGVPVVAARAGALPEVTGGAALLVDPTNEDALADALTHVLDDDTLRADLIARGHARVGEFPWSRCVDELVALYRQVTAR
jgi:glycosyltransferase involved in cell wall biosynthesis